VPIENSLLMVHSFPFPFTSSAGTLELDSMLRHVRN